MRVTKNVTPGRICSLCGKELERGTLGANFMPALNVISRAHVGCLQRWKREVIPARRAT
jgi:hypothetical protein